MNPTRRGIRAWLVDHREDAADRWGDAVRDAVGIHPHPYATPRARRARHRLRFWDILLDAYTFGGRR